MSKEVAKLLIRARARIEKVEHWTQGTSARDKHNTPVALCSPDACCWCATGALWSTDAPEYSISDAWGALYRVAGQPPPRINDTLGHAAVLKMYDDAIAAEQAAP